ncbi:hypothetical protein [Microcoleus sp. POL10_C6]|uniref:hypothetical protein n=1 Tax=unclassified Microcoleus TaxID=2642155 RepID=UPI002FD16F35
MLYGEYDRFLVWAIADLYHTGICEQIIDSPNYDKFTYISRSQFTPNLTAY